MNFSKDFYLWVISFVAVRKHRKIYFLWNIHGSYNHCQPCFFFGKIILWSSAGSIRTVPDTRNIPAWRNALNQRNAPNSRNAPRSRNALDSRNAPDSMWKMSRSLPAVLITMYQRYIKHSSNFNEHVSKK